MSIFLTIFPLRPELLAVADDDAASRTDVEAVDPVSSMIGIVKRCFHFLKIVITF